MTSFSDQYLDGNALAGEFSNLFAIDITAAVGKCANCGALKHIGETRLYVDAPGFVARCPECQYVLLRMVDCAGRRLFEFRGLAYVMIESHGKQ